MQTVLTDTEEQYYCCDARQNDRVLSRKKVLVQEVIVVHERLEETKQLIMKSDANAK